MNKHGQSARFAYDSTLVCMFIDQRKLRERGDWQDAYHGRTLRRWRKGAGITRWALDNFLTRWYADGEGEFVKWSKLNELDPVIRDKNTRR